MDPIDLAKLTTFHPLNEPVNFPVENVADEGETFEIPKVQNNCSEKKLDSFGSVKSSGRGRGKLREPVEDDFIARELRELSEHRNSVVFSRFNRSSNNIFGCSDDTTIKKASRNDSGYEEKAKGVTEAVPTQKKLGRGRGRAKKYVDMDGGVGAKNFDIQQ